MIINYIKDILTFMKGENIKFKLMRMGRTQAELAQLLGVSQQSISQVLNGTDVRTGTLEKIAKALGLSVGYFYDEEVYKQSIVTDKDVRAAYIRGKRDGYDEAIKVLLGREETMEEDKSEQTA